MPDGLTTRLEPITTRDRVADLIKKAVVSGDLKSGARIIELRLAKDLGLATTSIREALFELERQGFVTRIANKGAFVTELSDEDVQQIDRVRAELEGLALTLFKERAVPGDFDEFARILAKCVPARAPQIPGGSMRPISSFTGHYGDCGQPLHRSMSRNYRCAAFRLLHRDTREDI